MLFKIILSALGALVMIDAARVIYAGRQSGFMLTGKGDTRKVYRAAEPRLFRSLIGFRIFAFMCGAGLLYAIWLC